MGAGKDFQKRLTGLGYNPGPADGILGRGTADAFDNFLQDNGFEVDVVGERNSFMVTPSFKTVRNSIGGGVLTADEEEELTNVHPDMIKVVMRAKETCPQDFVIFDGIRNAEDQNALYKRKASTKDGYTNISKHQPQPRTGMGHAVDLVPRVNDQPVWDWDRIYIIAEHVHMAAKELGIGIRWGGCWQHINDLSGSPENWVAAYVKRKRKAGKRAFNDGPHFELYGY